MLPVKGRTRDALLDRDDVPACRGRSSPLRGSPLAPPIRQKEARRRPETRRVPWTNLKSPARLGPGFCFRHGEAGASRVGARASARRPDQQPERHLPGRSLSSANQQRRVCFGYLLVAARALRRSRLRGRRAARQGARRPHTARSSICRARPESSGRPRALIGLSRAGSRIWRWPPLSSAHGHRRSGPPGRGSRRLVVRAV